MTHSVSYSVQCGLAGDGEDDELAVVIRDAPGREIRRFALADGLVLGKGQEKSGIAEWAISPQTTAKIPDHQADESS